jgi:hypothetical protein
MLRRSTADLMTICLMFPPDTCEDSPLPIEDPRPDALGSVTPDGVNVMTPDRQASTRH